MARRPDFPIKLPLGAKVPTTRFTPRPLVPIQPAGSVIADFAVIGRPVPWSVPPKVRRKKPKLKAWQRLVSDCALLAYGSPGLYAGPVSLRLEVLPQAPLRVLGQGNARPDQSDQRMRGRLEQDGSGG